MALRPLTVILWGCLIATAAVAGPQHKMKIEVAVDDDGGEPKVFEWHGDGTTIDDLEVGESKTITDDDGNEITLTRTEEGLEIEVEGERIDVPHPAGDAELLHDKHAKKIIIDAGEDEDVIVREHKMVKIVKADHSGGITIISPDEIDEETRARLEQVLKDAGKDGEILFIDGSELHGDDKSGSRREVRVIRKKTDVTN